MSNKSTMNVTTAIQEKDLEALALAEDLDGHRVVLLDSDEEPEWDRMVDLWKWAQLGTRLPDRAMTPAEALAKRQKLCPVSGSPLFPDGTSSEYPQLDFSGVKRRALRRMAHGCRMACLSGKSRPEIVDLVAGHLARPSATFQHFMEMSAPEPRIAPEPVTLDGGDYRPALRVAPEAVNALRAHREKLAYYLEQDAVVADPATRFDLRKKIESCRAKIQELGG